MLPRVVCGGVQPLRFFQGSTVIHIHRPMLEECIAWTVLTTTTDPLWPMVLMFHADVHDPAFRLVESVQ